MNINNRERSEIFNTFLSSSKLVLIPIKHKTYHHFLRAGLFDSNIDNIAQSDNSVQDSMVS